MASGWLQSSVSKTVGTCCDALSSWSVVSRAFSALCRETTFGFGRRPLVAMDLSNSCPSLSLRPCPLPDIIIIETVVTMLPLISAGHDCDIPDRRPTCQAVSYSLFRTCERHRCTHSATQLSRPGVVRADPVIRGSIVALVCRGGTLSLIHI